MNTIIKKGLQSLALAPLAVFGISMAAPLLQTNVAYAAETCNVTGDNVGETGSVSSGIDCATNDNNKSDLFGGDGSIFTKIVNTLLFIIGAISVIMIVYGGFKYVTSGGDSSGVTSAKNTILYAVIGIVVALLAYAILNFVLVNLGQ